jgi:hypothetical protein
MMSRYGRWIKRLHLCAEIIRSTVSYRRFASCVAPSKFRVRPLENFKNNGYRELSFGPSFARHQFLHHKNLATTLYSALFFVSPRNRARGYCWQSQVQKSRFHWS